MKFMGVELAVAALEGAECTHCECFIMKHLCTRLRLQNLRTLGVWRGNQRRALLYLSLFPPDLTLCFRVLEFTKQLFLLVWRVNPPSPTPRSQKAEPVRITALPHTTEKFPFFPWKCNIKFQILGKAVFITP